MLLYLQGDAFCSCSGWFALLRVSIGGSHLRSALLWLNIIGNLCVLFTASPRLASFSAHTIFVHESSYIIHQTLTSSFTCLSGNVLLCRCIVHADDKPQIRGSEHRTNEYIPRSCTRMCAPWSVYGWVRRCAVAMPSPCWILTLSIFWPIACSTWFHMLYFRWNPTLLPSPFPKKERRGWRETNQLAVCSLIIIIKFFFLHLLQFFITSFFLFALVIFLVQIVFSSVFLRARWPPPAPFDYQTAVTNDVKSEIGNEPVQFF